MAITSGYRRDPGPTPVAGGIHPRSDAEALTERELDGLRLIGRGATNTEIGQELYISEGTVKTHVGRIFSKLGLRDRAAAVVFAFDHGLVRPES
ncbi:MAG: response regulator transcription factor [Actinobacteria bacterium]|nr:MAG: response regulator transcription factor [Actinomycetota bacterium]